MKRLISLLTVVFIFIINIYSQGLKWDWVKTTDLSKIVNVDGFAYGSSICNDAKGNTYATGVFKNSMYIDNSWTTGYGNSDIYVAKFDKAGKCLWIKSAGSTGDEAGYGIIADTAGNCYVTGSFATSTKFGDIEVPCLGGTDIFLAKYNTDGALQWVKTAGSSGNDQSTAISIDQWGNLYLTGSVSPNSVFGDKHPQTYGLLDIFIAKYDSDGNCKWATAAGSNYNLELGYSIKTDANGNSYVTGDFIGQAKFGNFTLNSSVDYFTDIFIAKYDSSGVCQWANMASGPSYDEGFAVTIDSKGNSYISGRFEYNINFGSLQLNNFSVGIYLAKYNNSGVLQWLKGFGHINSHSNTGYCLAADPKDNIYLTGTYGDSLTFNNIRLRSAGDQNVFLAKLDTTGVCQWATSCGASGGTFDFGRGISIDKNSIYITGQINGDATFGDITVKKTGTYQNGFIAKVHENKANMLSGTVTYASPNNKIIGGLKIYLTPEKGITIDSAFTDANGKYTFTKFPDGKYILTPYKYSSTGIQYFMENLPGQGINPGDALQINRYYIGMTDFKNDLCKQAAYVVPNDTIISPVGALLVNRHYIGNYPKFYLGTWYFDTVSVDIFSSEIEYNFKVICYGDVDATFDSKK